MTTLIQIQNWLKQVAGASRLSHRFIRVDESDEWKYSAGALKHISGRFFDVVGVRWVGHNGNTITQPLIKQEEIGTLGFLLRRGIGGNEILLQAKVEPGNMGVAQIAPTCQATASNIAQVHHGDLPPFAHCFQSGPYIYSSLQSEQGTRFLGKRNRNVMKWVYESIEETATHRWIHIEDILKMIDTDFLMNTDARSVLVCCPWRELIERMPFSKSKNKFAKELCFSYHFDGQHMSNSALIKYINSLKKLILPPQIIPLDEIKGRDKSFAIRHIQVSVHGREVPRWDQPIIDSTGEGYIDLYCGRMKGVLYFLFWPCSEPGLYNQVELGPTRYRFPGRVKIRIKCDQSEEGGRFFKDVNHYRIIDIGEVKQINKDDVWLTMSQIQHLLLKDGWFTNEARSALSLLLKWL